MLHTATTLISGTVSYNSASSDGGGLVIVGGTVKMQNASIHHNSAGNRGGGLHQWATAATVSIINTTISSNSATTGGGIYNESAIDLKFVTLAKNEATGSAANLFTRTSGAQTTIFATILTDPQLQSNCSGASLTSLGFNRINDDSCLTALTEDDLHDIPVELVTLADNGGFTLTHLPNSRAANAAKIVDIMPALTCQSVFGSNTALDQRGETRPILGLRGAGFGTEAKCDAGAVELGVEVHFVCGPPLLPIANNEDRCVYTTIREALDVAQEGDSVVISGVVTERVTINTNLTVRGPRAWEITPGTHMGFVQASPTAPTSVSGSAPIFTIPAGVRVTIEELNIRNGSSANGGAIHNAGKLDLKGVTIYQSRGTNGGAVYNSGTLTVTNSTLISNTATSGGGIFNAAAGTSQINHATLVNNTGGSIRNANSAATSAKVSGTILIGSSQCSGSLTDGGYNLIFGGTCSGLTSISSADPLLGPLRDNGGPTLTRAITSAASPAVTAGQPEAACTVAADQRGRTRPLNIAGNAGGRCDSGAVEFGAATLTLCQNCTADAEAHRFVNLQDALNTAMAGDTISIEPGAYTGNFFLYKDVTLQHAGIDLTGVSQEQPLDVRAILQASSLSVTEQKRLGQTAGTVLTVQGLSLNPSTGAMFGNRDVAVTLRGLTLRNGLSRNGGGIFNLGTLSIYTSTIAGNGASNRYDSSGNLVSGTAAQARGGAIYNSGTLLLERSTLSGNISEYYAGAIYVAGPSTGPDATVTVRSSTLADNRAARLPNQYVVGIQNALVGVPALTINSGDEVRFENRSSAQSHTLDVSPSSGVTCQVSQIVVPRLGVGLSDPLICTVGSATGNPTVNVSNSTDGAVIVQLTVRAVGFVPEGHIVYATGSTYSQFTRSILVKNAVSGDNCVTTELASRFRSTGYNLLNERSCQGSSSQTSDVIQSGSTLASAKLGPLQDNNQIDFTAKTVSGYTYAHALYPDSPAIDAIPPTACLAHDQLTVDLGSARISTINEGDTIIWRASQAATVVFNDGESTMRFVAVPGGTATSDAMQFTVAGVYPYRAYDNVNRAEIATGQITVAAKSRLTDQRGVLLPQRGTSRSYNCDMGAVEFQPWIVGQPLPRPPIAVGGQVPEWAGVADVQSYHVWSAATGQDYALRPSPENGNGNLDSTEMVTVKWETSTNSTASSKIDQVGIVEWPDAPQIHIAQVPVDLDHDAIHDGYLVSAARAFEGRISADGNAGNILSLGVFTRSLLSTLPGDSYSVLQFIKGSQSNSELKVVVVKSVDWNSAGVRDMRAGADRLHHRHGVDLRSLHRQPRFPGRASRSRGQSWLDFKRQRL